MSRREERERTEFSQSQQQDAINRSIDETKGNIRRAIDEVRKETPRYSQTVADFQNETADATREIADNFLESQKEVISSMTDSVAAGTRMATNMMFAGFEATRATTNYARHNSREVLRITSNTARIFGQTTRETVGRMQEASYGGTTTTGTATTTTGRTTGATEEGGPDTTRRK